MPNYQKQNLFPAGSTGNGTGAAPVVGDNQEIVAIQLNVTAAGATPTITGQPQGSHDGTNWFSLPYRQENSNTDAVTGRTITAVGSYLFCIDARLGTGFFPNYRLSCQANTNITYNADIYVVDRN